MKKFAQTLLALVACCSAALQAEEQEPIVFSTAPTHTREETVQLYTPLMNYLSEVTGRKFVIDPANNFIEYTVRMRLNKYDMLFDGPHLSGWRMVNTGHTPMVRLPGSIHIVVVAPEGSTLNSMEDLEMGQARVCAFASPNMLTMAFLSYFPHPARQPMMLRTQGFSELEECLRSGHGDAAVLRDKQWEKMDHTGLKLVAAPERGYPDRTFTLSNKLGEPLRLQIQKALLSEEGLKVSQAMLARFNKDKFIIADAREYDSLDKLLSPVWGFHSR